MDYDFLSHNGSSLKNIQFYRQTLPNVHKENGLIHISNNEISITIGDIEESIFLILMEYTFIPVWLLEQMLSQNLINKDFKETISSWIDIGFVWVDKNIAGEFIRPTYLIYEILNQKNNSFNNIPFNMLTKYITEQKIVFDTLIGADNHINKMFKDIFIKRYSPFGLDIDLKGTNILYGNQLITPKAFRLTGYENLNKIYNIISEDPNTSYEFKDFRAWTIIKKVNNTGDIKKDFKLHTPDLVIPSLKKNSIAIQIELVNRGVKYYTSLLENYIKNYIYKNIIFLCSSFTIYNNIRLAYNGLKDSTEIFESIYLFDLDIPSPFYDSTIYS